MNSNYFMENIKPIIRGFFLNLRLLRKNRLTNLSLYIILVLALIALIVPVLLPKTQNIDQDSNPEIRLMPPSANHLFGTDELGRDIFKRVLLGTRISLSTGITVVAVAILIGVPLGAVAGYFGGLVDEIIMRITDVFLGFPPLLLAIIIAAFMGPSLQNATIALISTGWLWYARIVRGQAVSVREKQFVKAAHAIGTPAHMIIIRHIIPNCLAPVIVQASMDTGSVIILLAALSFLGLGAQPPTPEWGLMVSTSRNYFLNAWWYGIFPGLAIFITVLAFNLLGDGLREILDPKTRKN